jgi:hypothetical protein
MTKEDIIESYATTLKSWVGLALSKEECVSLISDVTNEALSLGTVSQLSELLPDFLYESNGGIKVGVHGDSDVTEEWNEYLKKIR